MRRHWKWRPWAETYLTLFQARGTPSEALGGARFCLLDGSTEVALEGTRIEDLINVSHGIDFILDAWTKDFQTLGKKDIPG